VGQQRLSNQCDALETDRYSLVLIAVMLIFLIVTIPFVLSGPRDQGPLTNAPARRLTSSNEGGIAPPGLTISSLSSQLEQTSREAWSRTYGGPRYDSARSVVECSDGGFATVGTTESFGSGKRDVLLVRTDADGNLLWNQTYGGAGYDHGYSIVECQAGGFAIVGDHDLYTDDGGLWLLRTDADGTLLWNQTYGGKGQSIVECQAGGFAIVGNTPQLVDGEPSGWSDILLFRMSENGSLLWNQTYGWSRGDFGRSLVEVSGGGFAIVGDTLFPNDLPGQYVWLVRTDENGNHLWNHTYSFGTELDGLSFGRPEGHSVTECSDGNFAICGIFDYQESRSRDMYVLRTDADGTLLWNRTYGGSGDEAGYSIVECNDGGLAIVGYTVSFWTDADLWLVRTDADGNLLWDQSLGGGSGDFGYSIVQSDAGGFAIAGVTESFDGGNWDVWLLRFPSDAPAVSLPIPVPWAGIIMVAGMALIVVSGISLALKPHKTSTL
jgi:hypothetical protein